MHPFALSNNIEASEQHSCQKKLQSADPYVREFPVVPGLCTVWNGKQCSVRSNPTET